MTSYTTDSCVRGYHVYKDVWTASIGELLTCQAEFGNVMDPYDVAVVSGSNITVGHVPRSISAVCYSFLRRHGTIGCEIIGPRRFSHDLPQGGLEIPCKLTFRGEEMYVTKLKTLLDKAPTLEPRAPSSKRKKTAESSEEPNSSKDSGVIVWLRFNNYYMTLLDKDVVSNGSMLNDAHINCAQELLRSQFPGIDGLISTLYQNKVPAKRIERGVQIIHDRGNHWIVASSICDANEVLIYDSIYSILDGETKKVVENLFEVSDTSRIRFVQIQKQVGGKDCGLFAIAIVVSLLLHVDLSVSSIRFNQSLMRPHLLKCYTSNKFSMFPSV